MPRYIDADALQENMMNMVYSGLYGCEDMIDAVIEAPTVLPDEARGVVHCRECDLWNRQINAGRESLGNFVCSCGHWTVEDGAVLYTEPTDFCSYGERMVSDDAN